MGKDKKICGKYNFEIRRRQRRIPPKFKLEDVFVVVGDSPNNGKIITQGKTEDEVFDMIADAYKTAMDVEYIGWFKKILNKIDKLLK